MARVKYISSRPTKPSEPITTKSRPRHELVRDRHTGSYVEVPIKRLGQYTVEQPDSCHLKQPEVRLGEYTVEQPDNRHVKQPELLRPQSFPYGLPTPPPETQSSHPRKRRFSSNPDSDTFSLPPPALDINVSTIYDSPLVSKLRRVYRPTPPSSPYPFLERKIDSSEGDTIESELSSAIDTLISSASEEHQDASGKYTKPRWDNKAAAKAKEFWSNTYEPFNRGRQAHRLGFHYTSATERNLKSPKDKHRISDRSSDTISHDAVCSGVIKRRKLNEDRLSIGPGTEERRAREARSLARERYWRAWRKYREIEDQEHWEMFMRWKE